MKILPFSVPLTLPSPPLPSPPLPTPPYISPTDPSNISVNIENSTLVGLAAREKSYSPYAFRSYNDAMSYNMLSQHAHSIPYLDYCASCYLGVPYSYSSPHGDSISYFTYGTWGPDSVLHNLPYLGLSHSKSAPNIDLNPYIGCQYERPESSHDYSPSPPPPPIPSLPSREALLSAGIDPYDSSNSLLYFIYNVLPKEVLYWVMTYRSLKVNPALNCSPKL